MRPRVSGAEHRRIAEALQRLLDDVWPDDLKTFEANPNWSRWTIHTYHSHLVGFYQWAASRGWLTCDPTEELPTPPSGVARPKPVDHGELQHAIAHSPDPWLTCIYLGVGAGLRAAEMAAIRREDVTADYVHVREGKGGRERYVDTCAALWAFIRSKPPGLLVRLARGGAATAHWLSGEQQQHWRKIGLPGWHLHRLRHTFCTAMWKAGHDPLAIRDLMGHSSITTTQGYAQTTGRRAAVSAVDELLMGAPAGS